MLELITRLIAYTYGMIYRGFRVGFNFFLSRFRTIKDASPSSSPTISRPSTPTPKLQSTSAQSSTAINIPEPVQQQQAVVINIESKQPVDYKDFISTMSKELPKTDEIEEEQEKPQQPSQLATEEVVSQIIEEDLVVKSKENDTTEKCQAPEIVLEVPTVDEENLNSEQNDTPEENIKHGIKTSAPDENSNSTSPATVSPPPLKKIKLESDKSVSPHRKSSAGKLTGKLLKESREKLKKKKEQLKEKNAKGKKHHDHDDHPKKMKPSHFIAIQVTDPQIKAKIVELQEKMISAEVTNSKVENAAIFRDALIPKQKFHFTLHVFHASNEEELQKATSALFECFSKFKSDFEANPLNITIAGLAHFRNSVIFVKIREQQQISRLESLTDCIRVEFDRLGIESEAKPFRPHMTIAKISRSKKLGKMKIRSFPPEIWVQHADTEFGEQKIDGIQLLSMTDSDRTTGYYKSICQFNFDSNSTVSDDSGNNNIEASGSTESISSSGSSTPTPQ